MTDYLKKEDGFFILKEDGFKIILDRGIANSVNNSYDIVYDVEALGAVRVAPKSSFEFNRKVSVNMK